MSKDNMKSEIEERVNQSIHRSITNLKSKYHTKPTSYDDDLKNIFELLKRSFPDKNTYEFSDRIVRKIRIINNKIRMSLYTDNNSSIYKKWSRDKVAIITPYNIELELKKVDSYVIGDPYCQRGFNDDKKTIERSGHLKGTIEERVEQICNIFFNSKSYKYNEEKQIVKW